ncbi:fukutin-related protein isoform X3 [Nilaparvata lugens]|uniref:fukutin-related protein isoform X3 n=1 Tax=Nilaparvata lugens TaxID=108931 RepID=UPI00193DAAFA|nr:fukutin-related protein isoform X3 [Nilaparvata lugens]
MRIRIAKLITFVVLLLNVIAIYCIWKLLSSRSRIKSTNVYKSIEKETSVTLDNKDEGYLRLSQKDVTIVIRAFEEFENDIPETVKSILIAFRDINVIIVCDKPLYPPLQLNISSPFYRNVKIINLLPNLSTPLKDRLPIFHIKGKYVLFIPDSSRISSGSFLRDIGDSYQRQSQDILAIPFKSEKSVTCLKVKLQSREWTARFSNVKYADSCDFIRGRHALFMNSEILYKLSDPFLLPFPNAFYIQAASNNLNVKLATDVFLLSGQELYTSHHSKWKLQQVDRERTKAMYTGLQIKKVVKETGVTEWYGCRRDTQRCFGTVLDETPQYLYEGKWTPPCCLAGLRKVTRHVVSQLEGAGVRYWLEGGSLLGAMRASDILPWDYDVDIGIYQDDIGRCSWLQRATSKPVADQHGYIWEKAIEGRPVPSINSPAKKSFKIVISSLLCFF